MENLSIGLLIGFAIGCFTIAVSNLNVIEEIGFIHQRNDADFIELIEECEKELPRNQYCKVTVHP